MDSSCNVNKNMNRDFFFFSEFSFEAPSRHWSYRDPDPKSQNEKGSESATLPDPLTVQASSRMRSSKKDIFFYFYLGLIQTTFDVVVFIIDGCSFHYAHTWSKSGISICWRHLVTSKVSSNSIFFFEKRPWLHHTCATWNEQQCNIKTMVRSGFSQRSSSYFSIIFNFISPFQDLKMFLSHLRFKLV